MAEMLTSKAPIVKIPKTPEQRHLIETSIQSNILFSMLSLPAREVKRQRKKKEERRRRI